MFGEAGRRCAEVVQKWATTLFAVPLEMLNIRVVLAPVELGPYNRHIGYQCGREGSGVCWPKGPRTPKSTLTEVQMCHWPEMLRDLADMDDPRLPKCKPASDDRHKYAGHGEELKR
jgi:hypothetical protein